MTSEEKTIPTNILCNTIGVTKPIVISMLGQLRTVYEDCKEPNWDGYSAIPVTELSLKYAIQFLSILDDNTPLPNVGVSPHGDITFEWYISSNCLLSIYADTQNGYAIYDELTEDEADNTKCTCCGVFDNELPEAVSLFLDKFKRIKLQKEQTQ